MTTKEAIVNILNGPSPASSLPPAPQDLASLRDEFPGFRIWREVNGDRVRYIARRLSPGAGPHTVVTADQDELRAALENVSAELTT
jgi:hypothetical protein